MHTSAAIASTEPTAACLNVRSISSDTFARIAGTLDTLAHQPGSAALVVFSSTAYEALPPGTPTRELGSFARFFRPHSPGAGYAPAYPPNPWSDAFSSGTSISTGLRNALGIVDRDGLRRPAVVLVSDLDDDGHAVDRISLRAVIGTADGALVRASVTGDLDDAEKLGAALAAELLDMGGPVTRGSLPGETLDREFLR